MLWNRGVGGVQSVHQSPSHHILPEDQKAERAEGRGGEGCQNDGVGVESEELAPSSNNHRLSLNTTLKQLWFTCRKSPPGQK